MSLSPGTRLGPYEIESPLGAGGMGEVYKARDTRLDRTVAIKVLPEHVAGDPDLKQRFEREAKTISSLNHPHICSLYDVGEDAGTTFLVMEYLDGDTLAARLTQGPLPTAQVLKIATEIADALDKAHRQGITHRDLKPGNIMLTKSGAKLLDFGLAKLRPAGTLGADGFSAAATQSEPLTGRGTILGTLQYMAPEQLEGKEADHRTDIFAFGAVVYEMATGQRAFTGDSEASLIAAILDREPVPMSTLQPVTPARLDEIVKTCLAKDPDDRWQSSGDVARLVKGIIAAASQTGEGVPVGTVPGGAGLRRVVPRALGALVLGVLVTGFTVWQVMQPGVMGVTRTVITPPVDEPLAGGVAISPDGSWVVYVAAQPEAQGGRQLVVQHFDSYEPTPLRGAARNAFHPFISPDGTWIGVWDLADHVLKKVPVLGGQSSPIVSLPLPTGRSGLHFRGASWESVDSVVFATASEPGLRRVSVNGGQPTPLTTVDVDGGEIGHWWPEVLPGGGAVLFTIQSAAESAPEARGVGTCPPCGSQIAVVSVDTGEIKTLFSGGTDSYPARYSSTGHIVYRADGRLWAVPFDASRLDVTGAPVLVLEDIARSGAFGRPFGIARDGTLVYVPGNSGTGNNLVWVDRQGQQEPLDVEPKSYYVLNISSDGRRAAVDIADANGRDIWVIDLERETLSRLTSHAGSDAYPVWTPDSQRIIFRSLREGPANLYITDANGASAVRRLTDTGLYQTPGAVTPDGRRLVLSEFSDGSYEEPDLAVLSLESEGDGSTERLFETAFDETNAVLSADGRWVAYQSDRTGRLEVFVRPFPAVDEEVQISTNGGRYPVWAPDDQELFYMAGQQLIAVPVRVDPTFAVTGAPETLFEWPFIGIFGRNFDVDPNEPRFLMVKPVREQFSGALQIRVVQNWHQELRRLVPVP